MAGIPWTSEEEKILTEMANAGKMLRDVLRVMPHRTIASINSKTSAMGLSLAGPKYSINLEAYAEIMKAEREIKCL